MENQVPPPGSLPTLLAIVFVDLLGFSLILPLLPFYAEDFGATPTVVGFLVASYAGAQLVGAPLLGSLSDRFGRRPVLVASILGTAAGFVIFGLAGSLTVLFLARILDGLTGGNISVAQAYIADVSPPDQRARNFGLIGAAFGLGFIIGPAMGGFLSRWGYAVPAFVAAGMATLNALAAVMFLPESLPAEERTGHPERKGSRARGWRHVVAGDRAGGILWTRFWFALAFVTFQTVFPLWAQYRLELNAEQTGYILGYVGVLIVGVQLGAVGPVTRRFGEGPVILFAIVLMAGALAAWAFAPSVPVLMISQIPIALAGGLFGANINSALSRSVAPHEVGGVLGIGASLEALTRALAPSIGGILLGRLATWAPGVFASLLLVFLFPFAVAALRRPGLAPGGAGRAVSGPGSAPGGSGGPPPGPVADPAGPT